MSGGEPGTLWAKVKSRFFFAPPVAAAQAAEDVSALHTTREALLQQLLDADQQPSLDMLARGLTQAQRAAVGQKMIDCLAAGQAQGRRSSRFVRPLGRFARHAAARSGVRRKLELAAGPRRASRCQLQEPTAEAIKQDIDFRVARFQARLLDRYSRAASADVVREVKRRIEADSATVETPVKNSLPRKRCPSPTYSELPPSCKARRIEGGLEAVAAASEANHAAAEALKVPTPLRNIGTESYRKDVASAVKEVLPGVVQPSSRELPLADASRAQRAAAKVRAKGQKAGLATRHRLRTLLWKGSKSTFKAPELAKVRRRQGEDYRINIPEQPTLEDIEQALDSITWPCCRTRKNVAPDEVDSIHAFPLGMVNNYARGLQESSAMRAYPRLTRLLNRWMVQECARRGIDMRWTTIQLNSGFAAKLHVDSNNEGPSLGLAVGSWTSGGRLWLHDPYGHDWLEAPCKLKGYAHIEVGQKLPGTFMDIRKPTQFDGCAPHAVEDFGGGQRRSVVFFARRGALKMKAKNLAAWQTLEEAGFTLPDTEWIEQHSTVPRDEKQPPMSERLLGTQDGAESESSESACEEDMSLEAEFDRSSPAQAGRKSIDHEHTGIEAAAVTELPATSNISEPLANNQAASSDAQLNQHRQTAGSGFRGAVMSLVKHIVQRATGGGEAIDNAVTDGILAKVNSEAVDGALKEVCDTVAEAPVTPTSPMTAQGSMEPGRQPQDPVTAASPVTAECSIEQAMEGQGSPCSETMEVVSGEASTLPADPAQGPSVQPGNAMKAPMTAASPLSSAAECSQEPGSAAQGSSGSKATEAPMTASSPKAVAAEASRKPATEATGSSCSAAIEVSRVETPTLLAEPAAGALGSEAAVEANRNLPEQAQCAVRRCFSNVDHVAAATDADDLPCSLHGSLRSLESNRQSKEEPAHNMAVPMQTPDLASVGCRVTMSLSLEKDCEKGMPVPGDGHEKRAKASAWQLCASRGLEDLPNNPTSTTSSSAAAARICRTVDAPSRGPNDTVAGPTVRSRSPSQQRRRTTAARSQTASTSSEASAMAARATSSTSSQAAATKSSQMPSGSSSSSVSGRKMAVALSSLCPSDNSSQQVSRSASTACFVDASRKLMPTAIATAVRQQRAAGAKASASGGEKMPEAVKVGTCRDRRSAVGSISEIRPAQSYEVEADEASQEDGEDQKQDEEEDEEEVAKIAQQELDGEEDLGEVPEDAEEQDDDGRRKLKKKQLASLSLLEKPRPLQRDYPQDAWPQLWQGKPAPAPGDHGFNKYAKQGLKAVLSFWQRQACRQHEELQHYQKLAAAACHPLAPTKRLLVDVRMGAGKTKILLQILDHHFEDPRKKVPVLPKQAHIDNLFDELLRWPGKYRSYFSLVQPLWAARAVPLHLGPDEVAGNYDATALRKKLDAVDGLRWDVPAAIANEVREKLRAELEMTDLRAKTGDRIVAIKGGRLTQTFKLWFLEQFPQHVALMPGAPLRAMRLTTAGGAYGSLTEQGKPRNPLAQFGFDNQTKNAFDNAVVIVDEVHNVVSAQCYAEQCRRLRQHLWLATGSTIVGLTGTPVPDDPKVSLRELRTPLEGRREGLMGMMKGASTGLLKLLTALAACTGYSVVATWLLFRQKMQPLRDKRGLEGYVVSYHGALPGSSADLTHEAPTVIELPPIMCARYALKHGQKARSSNARRVLQTYTNLEVAASHATRSPYKMRSLKDPTSYCPKLLHVARSVVKDTRKTVVLVREHTGFKLFRMLLEQCRRHSGQSFGIASLAQKAEFNCGRTNLRGERYRVMVAETGASGEGVSFFAVRVLWLPDMPINATEFAQASARVDRANGHAGLEEHERKVSVRLVCGELPEALKDPLAAFLWKASVRHGPRNARQPGEWQTLLQTLGDVQERLSAAYSVDTLEELCELVKKTKGLRRFAARGEDSDEECLTDDDLKYFKKCKVWQAMETLSDQSQKPKHVQKLERSLCVSTVDTELYEELFARVDLVAGVHKRLQDAAMTAG
eukprot:TRINITY_DN64411_c0_g1_i1.p1 TRINITY_DN64411_c0_g1~~TRINITY_DN64411_c0_g1_i1.p1  ORF type:complete len:2003 (-),score=462.44 TRINITY_DN64411_c0_g1_i1:77-6085(-)